MHLSYLKPLEPCSSAACTAMAHITGGGFYDNIPRVLPAAAMSSSTGELDDAAGVQGHARKGTSSCEEMHHVFNMGIGMVVFVGGPATWRGSGALWKERGSAGSRSATSWRAATEWCVESTPA